MSLYHVNKGVFVCFVGKGSPAAMAGIRFGDQILTVSLHVCEGVRDERCMYVRGW